MLGGANRCPKGEVGGPDFRTGLLRPLLVPAPPGGTKPSETLTTSCCARTILYSIASGALLGGLLHFCALLLRLLQLFSKLTPEVLMEALLQHLHHWRDAQEAVHELTCRPLCALQKLLVCSIPNSSVGSLLCILASILLSSSCNSSICWFSSSSFSSLQAFRYSAFSHFSFVFLYVSLICSPIVPAAC